MTWFIVCLAVFFFLSVFFGVKHEEIQRKDPESEWLKTLPVLFGMSTAAWIVLIVVFVIMDIMS